MLSGVSLSLSFFFFNGNPICSLGDARLADEFLVYSDTTPTQPPSHPIYRSVSAPLSSPSASPSQSVPVTSHPLYSSSWSILPSAPPVDSPNYHPSDHKSFCEASSTSVHLSRPDYTSSQAIATNASHLAGPWDNATIPGSSRHPREHIFPSTSETSGAISISSIFSISSPKLANGRPLFCNDSREDDDSIVEERSRNLTERFKCSSG